MSMVGEIFRMVMAEVRPFIGAVEYVTGISIDAAGNVTSQGVDVEGDGGHAIDSEAGWHFGFSSRPKDGATGVVMKAGGKSGMSFLVGYRNRQYEISLQPGEVAMYNEAGASIKLDVNGKILGTPKSGQTVELAGNTSSALKTETLLSDLNNLMTYLATWVPLVVTAVSMAPSGLAADPGVAVTAGTISTAIGAGTYKSTVLKHG